MYIIVIWDAYLKIITQRRLMGARLQWREKRTSNSNVNPQEQRKRTINSSKKANITSSIHTRVCVCVYVCMVVTQSFVSDSVTPWTVACQAPLFMEFSRQEQQSGLSFPSPGDLPNPGIEPGSPTLQADSSPSEPQGSPYTYIPLTK